MCLDSERIINYILWLESIPPRPIAHSQIVYWQKIMLRSGESYFRDVAFQGRRNVCKGFLQLRSLLWMLAK